MRTPPLHHLLILPHRLTQLCSLSSCLVSLGPAMKVCPTFGFLGLLRQSNLALSSSAFYHTHHTFRGDILLTPPGILIIVHWTKAIQIVGRYPVLPISAIPGHPADPITGNSCKLHPYPHLINHSSPFSQGLCTKWTRSACSLVHC